MNRANQTQTQLCSFLVSARRCAWGLAGFLFFVVFAFYLALVLLATTMKRFVLRTEPWLNRKAAASNRHMTARRQAETETDVNRLAESRMTAHYARCFTGIAVGVSEAYKASPGAGMATFGIRSLSWHYPNSLVVCCKLPYTCRELGHPVPDS